MDAFNPEDMLRAHGLMMRGLCPDAGHFRRGGVGVFSGSTLVHMAPPAHAVPTLVQELFEWVSSAEDHLLVRSCVFLYELEFIHPFADGNGRIGRLWQSLLLKAWHPAFFDLPVENLVYAHQSAYYDAIAQSSSRADCSPFIDFMLSALFDALRKHLHDGINDGIKLSDTERHILSCLRRNDRLTAKDIAETGEIQIRAIERAMASLKRKGLLFRIGARRNGRWCIKG